MPPEEPPTALRAPSERSRWPPEATKTPRETSCGLLLCNFDGKMQRQMGAKTSGNFWHIILGHGHCGGVGAQRIEIIKLIIMRQKKMNKKTIMNATKKWSTGMHYTCTVARQAHHLGLRFRMCPTRREAYNNNIQKLISIRIKRYNKITRTITILLALIRRPIAGRAC